MDRKQLPQLAADVAKCLGELWTAETSENGYTNFLINPEGTKLWLRLDERHGKVVVGTSNGELYDFIPYDESFPEIGVSASKSPEKIARDIQQRLLPEYTRVLSLCKAGKARHDAYVAQAQQVANRLAGILKITPRDYRNGVIELFGAYVHAEVSGERVDLKFLNLDAEQAATLLRAYDLFGKEQAT